MMKKLFLALGLFNGCLLAQSATDTLRTDSLPTVFVSASRSAQVVPLSSTRLTEAQIRTAQPMVSLAESLPAVPGVFVMNDANYAQDLRVSIRGFGARGGFGIRGIRIFLDGIPESSPDGQAQVDNIDPAILNNIEVLRGASAGLYGNASGGIIHLRSALPTQNNLSFRHVIGSYGLAQYRLSGALTSAQTAISGGITHVRTNAYRQQSAMRSTMANLILHHTTKHEKPWQFRLLTNYTNSPKADDPGGLTLAQDSINRRSAHPLNVQFQAGESVEQGRVALIIEKPLAERQKIAIRSWSAWRDFVNRLPFRSGGQVAFQRWAGGASLQWEYQQDSAWQLYAGLDLERQSDRRQRYDNNEGLRGNLSLDQLETYSNAGLFGSVRWQPLARLSLHGGLRGDLIGVGVLDQFLSDGAQSGQRSFRQFSQWLGMQFRLSDFVQIYASASSNFEIPTLIELTNNPDGTGGLAAGLGPQHTQSAEVGIRGSEKNRWRWEIAAFWAETTNELTPYEIEGQSGRTYYRNAGETRRMGLEAALYYPLTKRWLLWLNGTLARYQFTVLEQQGNDLSGNQIPGIPASHGQVSLRYQWPSGLLVQSGLQVQGRIFADNANTVSIAPVQVLSARIGWERTRASGTWVLFAGADNLTGVRVYNNIRINAAGGRYYEAGAPGMLLAGLVLSFY